MTSADLQRSIVLSILVIPLLGAVVAFPFALFLLAVTITSAPWLILIIIAAGAASIWFIWRALRHPRWWMTSTFIGVAAMPILFWFFVRPVLEANDFRKYRHIPKEDKIVYYKQSYGRDMDRFALIELSENRINRDSPYRPIPNGAKGTVEAISKSLGIPSWRLPDLSKESIRYYGGENESASQNHVWMFLTVTDLDTRQHWIMEYSY